MGWQSTTEGAACQHPQAREAQETTGTAPRAERRRRGRTSIQCSLMVSILSIAPPCLRDRTDDDLFERRPIKISKLLEVQARLAHLVLAKPGQQGPLGFPFSVQVDHQFAATDGKARQRHFPGSSTLVGVS